MSPPVDNTRTLEQDGLRISVHALPAVNLALVHNTVPLVFTIEITNVSDVDLTDLTVTAHLFSGDSELTASATRTHDGLIAPGASVVWDDFQTFTPSTEYLKGLNESRQGSITLTLSSVWSTATQVTIPIRILAHNEWFSQYLFLRVARRIRPAQHPRSHLGPRRRCRTAPNEYGRLVPRGIPGRPSARGPYRGRHLRGAPQPPDPRRSSTFMYPAQVSLCSMTSHMPERS